LVRMLVMYYSDMRASGEQKQKHRACVAVKYPGSKHHMDSRVLALVTKKQVPTELLREMPPVSSCHNSRATRAQQSLNRFRKPPPSTKVAHPEIQFCSSRMMHTGCAV